MIALTAYGIRKAYKKQQARKARKAQLERENQDSAVVEQADELQSASLLSSSRQSPHLRQVDGGLVGYSSGSPLSPRRAETSACSTYSASSYSQTSLKDPLEEMRQYQEYIQRQTYDFGTDINPPTYEFVVGQDGEATRSWKSELNVPREAMSVDQIQEARHIPEGSQRVVELDSSSESSRDTPQHVPLRLFNPRSPVTSGNAVVPAPTELPSDIPEHITSPIQADDLRISLNDLVVEVPSPLKIRKSKEVERFELPANEVPSHSLEDEGEQDEKYTTEPERQQLKRPRSESGSEIESEDNEEVIVRFSVADRTKRPFSKRMSVAE